LDKKKKESGQDKNESVCQWAEGSRSIVADAIWSSVLNDDDNGAAQ